MAWTVYDALVRASAQQYSGEAQTDELEEEETLKLYMQYANEGFRRIWRQIDPIDIEQLPTLIHLDCPELESTDSLEEYDPRVFDCLADYVTWRMLGTGNLTKQERGEWYYQRFLETLARIPKHGSWDEYYKLFGNDAAHKFQNVYSW